MHRLRRIVSSAALALALSGVVPAGAADAAPATVPDAGGDTGALPAQAESMSITIRQTAGVGVLAKLTLRTEGVAGQPAQESSADRWFGAGAPNLWFSPARLKALKPGQVIDEDKLIKSTLVFKGVEGKVATFVDSSPIDVGEASFDIETGQLVRIRTTQEIVVGDQRMGSRHRDFQLVTAKP